MSLVEPPNRRLALPLLGGAGGNAAAAARIAWASVAGNFTVPVMDVSTGAGCAAAGTPLEGGAVPSSGVASPSLASSIGILVFYQNHRKPITLAAPPATTSWVDVRNFAPTKPRS